MPYKIIKQKCKQANGKDGEYILTKADTGQKVSCHATEEMARKAIKARHMREGMYLQEAKLILENKLTKMISKGLLSKDSIIKAGQAGMVPSMNKTVSGILKGTENKLIKNRVTKQIADSELSPIHWKMLGSILPGKERTLVQPTKRPKHAAVLLKRHEADEAAAQERRLFPKQKSKKGRMINTSNIKFLSPKTGKIVNATHASFNVLKREKEIVDKITNMYPGTRMAKKFEQWKKYRNATGEYPATEKLRHARDIRKADNK